jgi:hypothetical protein
MSPKLLRICLGHLERMSSDRPRLRRKRSACSSITLQTLALVDFHLRGGEVSSALIARLHEQGVPVIITSGSAMDFLPPAKIATILEKPFSELQLLAILHPLIAHKAALRR